MALAQTAQPRAALVHAEGQVFLDDRPVTGAAPVDLDEAALVRTASGRAVVALKRGGSLTLDSHSRVRIVANGNYNFNRIEILDGSAIVDSGASAPLVTCRSEVRLSSDGTFRFDVPNASGTQCRFRVFDGAAAVPLATVTNALRSGQSMTLDPTCGDMIPTVPFSTGQLDDFDRWTRRHVSR